MLSLFIVVFLYTIGIIIFKNCAEDSMYILVLFLMLSFIISVLFRLYRGSNDNFWCNDCETDINKLRLIEAILCCLLVFEDSRRPLDGPRSYILRTAVKVHDKFAVNDQSYRRHFVKIDRKVRSWRQVNLLVRSYTSGPFFTATGSLRVFFLFFSTSLVTCNLQFIVAVRKSNLNRANDSTLFFFHLAVTFSTFPTKKYDKKFLALLVDGWN